MSIELPPLFTFYSFDHGMVEVAKVADVEARERILMALIAELEADAERYRWLRSRVPGGAYRIMGVIYSEGGAGVDAAIDAARGAK